MSLLYVSFVSAYHRVSLSTYICKYLRISTRSLFQSHSSLLYMSLLYISFVCLFCMSLLYVSFVSAYHRVSLSTYICKRLRTSTHTLFQSHSGLFCMSLLYVSFVCLFCLRIPSSLSLYIYLQISTYIHTYSLSIFIKRSHSISM